MRTALRSIIFLIMLAITGVGNTAYAQTASIDDGQKIHVTAIAHIGDLLFASTRRNGVYMSSDSGRTWGPVNNGLPNNAYVIDLAANGNTLFAVGYKTNLTLFSSADKGASWKEVSVSPKVTKVYSATAFKNKVFAATDVGLFRSADNGTSWGLVDGVEAADVTNVVATPEQMLANVYKDSYTSIYYVSGDGEDWHTAKADGVMTETIEAHGNLIVGRRCSHTQNMDNLHTCKISQAWVLSKNGKKWEKIDRQPRYFGFDEDDNMYAISTSVDEKKKQFIYTREIVKSADRGRSWKAVDEKTDPFIQADQGMRDLLAELDVWRVLELQEPVWAREATARSEAEKAAKRKELLKKQAEENARFSGSTYQSSGVQKYNSNSNAPDYRALSNDRFKAMHNHRDSWIDSKGGMHIH